LKGLSLFFFISLADPSFFSCTLAFLPPAELKKFPSLFCIPSYPDIAGQIWSRKCVNSKISISGEIVENRIFFLATLILQFLDLWDLRYGP
jgi:hypothetical protein